MNQRGGREARRRPYTWRSGVPIRDDVESRYGKIFKQHKLVTTDVDLGQREVEVNGTFRKLFR